MKIYDVNASEQFIEQLNKLGMKSKYEKNRNILYYLEDALTFDLSVNEDIIEYIIRICLFRDEIDLVNFINECDVPEYARDVAIKLLEKEINYTILEMHEVNNICIWIVDNFPEKERDVYKSLLEYGYEESIDWIIRRIDGYENLTYDALELAIEIEAPSDVIKKLWNLYKYHIDDMRYP
ncbi:MAG: hypothetical protein ACRCZI_05760 [Cetobacterium sp.]